MQATVGCTRLTVPTITKGTTFAPKVTLARASRSKAVSSSRSLATHVVAKADSSSSPEEFDRRAFLHAVSIGAISVASSLAMSEDANALNTYTQPKPFKSDYEKYKDRPGGTVAPMQMARMRSEFRDVAKGDLMAAVPGIQGAYPGLLKLAFMDAGTFNIWKHVKPNGVEPSGGSNGSLLFEIDRPEMAPYKDLLKALEPVKVSVDAKWASLAKSKGSPRAPDPISWADLITMAAVVATIQKWGASPEGGFPVRQGRMDAKSSDPSNRTLPFTADLVTAQKWFSKRGLKENEMLPLWMELTENTASLRADSKTAARMAVYEADTALFQKDFMHGFTKLTSLGSTFDAYMYFYDESPFLSGNPMPTGMGGPGVQDAYDLKSLR